MNLSPRDIKDIWFHCNHIASFPKNLLSRIESEYKILKKEDGKWTEWIHHDREKGGQPVENDVLVDTISTYYGLNTRWTAENIDWPNVDRYRIEKK